MKETNPNIHIIHVRMYVRSCVCAFVCIFLDCLFRIYIAYIYMAYNIYNDNIDSTKLVSNIYS